RLHAGEDAAAAAHALSANAFATGNQIVFGAGRFSPQTRRGRNLIAHELAHVAQQSAAPAHGQRLIQRQTHGAAATQNQDEEEVIAVEESPRYKGIDYHKAAAANYHWFDALQLQDANPLAPFNPADTPIAFINRVVQWQIAVQKDVGGVSFAQFVF